VRQVKNFAGKKDSKEKEKKGRNVKKEKHQTIGAKAGHVPASAS
jgi:hypothetical protein